MRDFDPGPMKRPTPDEHTTLRFRIPCEGVMCWASRSDDAPGIVCVEFVGGRLYTSTDSPDLNWAEAYYP